MDYEGRLAISYYKEIGSLNQEHNITLVQHIQNDTVCVRKTLSIYNRDVYQALKDHPVPGIPRIYAIYEDNGVLIVIEEYIAGRTLGQLLDSHPLDDKQIKYYIASLCNICNCLHSFTPAIIHRDINPANIIITESDTLYLVDLNIARPVREGATSDTTYLGTNGFAAPEQYGFGASSIQTDIYGIGAVLRYMLKCSNVNNELLSSISKRATMLAPSDRYKNTMEIIDALDAKLPDTISDSVPTSRYNKFLLPGFRHLEFTRMLIALPLYGFLFAICFGLTLRNPEGSKTHIAFITWYYRIMVLIVNLLTILFAGNYLGIHRKVPFCSHKNEAIRIMAITIWSIVIWFVLLCTVLLMLAGLQSLI